MLKMVVKPFGRLDDGDAVRDGFTSLSELKEALEYTYGKIQDTEYVSIYTIELHEHVRRSLEVDKTAAL